MLIRGVLIVFLLLVGVNQGLASNYTDNGNDTVTDQKTGLVWQLSELNVTRTWQEALVYCNELSLAGGGWRLPNIKELSSIVDDTRTDLLIDPVFIGTYASGYWSSTTEASYPSYAWFVGFDTGVVVSNDKSASYYVRCVR